MYAPSLERREHVPMYAPSLERREHVPMYAPSLEPVTIDDESPLNEVEAFGVPEGGEWRGDEMGTSRVVDESGTSCGDEGVTPVDETPGVDEGVDETPGVDEGVDETPGVDEGVDETPIMSTEYVPNGDDPGIAGTHNIPLEPIPATPSSDDKKPPPPKKSKKASARMRSLQYGSGPSPVLSSVRTRSQRRVDKVLNNPLLEKKNISPASPKVLKTRKKRA
eukprot:GHVO01045292.1.p1 GENE.GHVO01045292.1~~GHVO01045292.1.p1  ORF type:complete len:221 (+),score=61.74 GHVO01045292.1:2-664(+)